MANERIRHIELKEDKSIYIPEDEYRYLTDEEFSKINANFDSTYRKKFIVYNNEIYYVKNKPNRSDLLMNEIISEKVSEFFDLDTVKSELYSFKKDNKYLDDCVLLTKKFCDDDKIYGNFDIFVNAEEKFNIGLSNFDKLGVYLNPKSKELIDINPESLEKLKLDLKKMLVADFACEQYNRRKENYMFECDGDNVKLMPLYNYSDSFYVSMHKKNYGLLEFDYLAWSVRRKIRKDKTLHELLEKLDDIDIDSILDEVEDKFSLKYTDSNTEVYKRRINDAKYVIKRDKLVK